MSRKQLNWRTTPHEAELITRIVQRAVAVAKQHKIDYNPIDADMDVTACHLNGCKLQLAELEAAPAFDFAHDIFGIRRHLNRTTGQLEDCFLPRYAVRQSAA